MATSKSEIDDIIIDKMNAIYAMLYNEAVSLNESSAPYPNDIEEIIDLGRRKHAARGVLLTCAVYKIICPEQDIRFIKVNDAAENEGYSFRNFDEHSTVPFLMSKHLAHNVQGHMQTSSLSFAYYKDNLAPKTQPAIVGKELLHGMNYLQSAQDTELASKNVAITLLRLLIEERDKNESQKVSSPTKLTIDRIMELLTSHIMFDYGKNSARLPQIAIYAIYQCIVGQLPRYSDCHLKKLESQKTANRKTGTAGDIDVNSSDGFVFEAVEIKHKKPVTLSDVREVVNKISYAPMDRYLILSTDNSKTAEYVDIKKTLKLARTQYGCEIIVNGVFDTIKYYLRLLPTPDLFVANYVNLLRNDKEVSFEMREKWNMLCSHT